jgi:predicted nicotinamide N-methyase
VSAAGAFDVLLGRLALVGAPIAATIALLLAPPLAGWLAALALLGAAAIVAWLVGWERRSSPARAAFDELAVRPPARPADGSGGFEALVQPGAATYLGAALAAGALTMALLATLPYLVTTRGGFDAAFVGVALALGGLGALGLRLPAARLRARLPAAALVAVLVWALALSVALIGALGSLVLGVPLLILVGSIGAAIDAELLVGLRRAGDAAPVRLRWLVAAFALGQLAGALKVALLGLEPQLFGGPLVAIALAAGALMGGAIVVDRRSLFALRHQVQQFSWDASPPPRAHEIGPPTTRAARLAGWIHRQVETELVDVTLPVSGRRYAIARPSGEGRDALFEAAKADPDRQMPYWAKVWPSGVALADVCIERAAEVGGQQLLELGAGLGVTACAVLAEGGNIVTADYSLLPLALCRLNGLANTGRAPGSICFNWRDRAQVQEVLHRHPPIGLILAADVLYEGRDVMPLVDVIEQLLAPEGSLWLAEPVRRTAQRFLDHVAALGWQIDSRRIRADWPDASSGWVNVHIIRREQQPADAALGLGGWQI